VLPQSLKPIDGAVSAHFSKVRTNCRSRRSQIWTIELDPSLKGATRQDFS
jgi:hypothetical protein